ncbi:hypothetical protein [Paenarthrobacter aromaticivorans]|uniref:Uncharacterized protein n=1 Tax=Paenarthrobacter aromaticivorans TaxID=2849150 RepID=A0ABS6I795_9MICC|nr:hypothetical protein [Paenarthrobacter sp. MMS21-TAE1-1]MBU8866616.1 hypothetical protein [Paenarthrobacter sp. MMS21-TAE1-1]
MKQARDDVAEAANTEKESRPARIPTAFWMTAGAALGAIAASLGISRLQSPSPPIPTETPPVAKDDDKGSPQTPPGVWVAIAAAVAIIATIFTTLGVEGDTLRRMVRNEPDATGTAISWVIFGAAIFLLPVLVKLLPITGRWISIVLAVCYFASAVAVVYGLIRVLNVAADSLNSRDMPGLSLKVTKSSSNAATIESEATAASIRSSDKMLLRIYGVGAEFTGDLRDACQDGQLPTVDTPPAGSRLLQWGEAGPDKAGAVKISDTLVVDTTNVRHVCAYAALIREHNSTEPYQLAWSIIDVQNLTSVPSGAGQTTAAPGPASVP